MLVSVSALYQSITRFMRQLKNILLHWSEENWTFILGVNKIDQLKFSKSQANVL